MIAWLLALGCSGDGTTEPTDTPPATTGDTASSSPTGDTAVPEPATVEALLAALQADGFEVQEGRVGVLPLEDCCGWNSCLKWNPSNLYTVWFLPLSPGESSVGRPLESDGTAWHWRLRPDELVLYVGEVPPEARYVSYRSYVHETFYEPLQARVNILGSLGDSMNQTVLAHGGDGEPWGQPTMVATLADQGIEGRLRAALREAGWDEGILNIDAVPASLAKLGIDDDADTIRMNNRVGIIEDPGALTAWAEQPAGRVFRLTPTVEVTALQPYPAPTFRLPGSGADELYLQGAADALRDAIHAAHPGLEGIDAVVNVREPEIGEDCWSGCNRDASKSNTIQFTLPDDPDEFVVVYGVNHHATGHAAYHNAIVFGTDNDDPAAWIDDRDMVGSARDYLPDHPDADLLYAWTFARDCAGRPHCTDVPYDCPGVAEGELPSIHWRAYLDPVSGTHPLAAELVTDGAIKFAP